MNTKFKIGDKIKIPKTKSTGDMSLGSCTAIMKAKGLNQDYLYITDIDDDNSDRLIFIVGTTENAKHSTFLEYDLEHYEEKRKIIGYKVPYNLFNGNIKKGTIFLQKANMESYGIDGNSTYNLPREIVETWEPVYEEEKLTIGEYEIIIKDSKTTMISAYIFTKEWWIASKIISEHSKSKVMIGCSHQFDLSLDLINKVLDRLN